MSVVKIKKTQLAELWIGDSHYQLLKFKGMYTQFVITRHNPMAVENRICRIVMKDTFMAVIHEWEKLFPEDEGDRNLTRALV